MAGYDDLMSGLGGFGRGIAGLLTLGMSEIPRATQQRQGDAVAPLFDPSATPQQKQAAIQAYLSMGGDVGDIAKVQQYQQENEILSQAMGGFTGQSGGQQVNPYIAAGIRSKNPMLQQLGMFQMQQEADAARRAEERAYKEAEKGREGVPIEQAKAATFANMIDRGISGASKSLYDKAGGVNRAALLNANVPIPDFVEGASNISSDLGNIREGIVKFLTGAGQGQKEAESMAATFLPTVADSPQDIEYKFQKAREIAKDIRAGLGESALNRINQVRDRMGQAMPVTEEFSPASQTIDESVVDPETGAPLPANLESAAAQSVQKRYTPAQQAAIEELKRRGKM